MIDQYPQVKFLKFIILEQDYSNYKKRLTNRMHMNGKNYPLKDYDKVRSLQNN